MIEDRNFNRMIKDSNVNCFCNHMFLARAWLFKIKLAKNNVMHLKKGDLSHQSNQRVR